ncbi:MAG TPA: response regulator [Tepidisphaeraceae bacterium]|jgi:CheY-like chemotaxis protein
MGTGSRRILVVDDHADSALLLARLLKKEGHDVKTAGTVSAAREICELEKFDLLISDLGLPDGSGYELFGFLRDRYGMKGIALSGRGLPEDVAASEEAGFEAHLVKPVILPDVSAAIARLAADDGNS